jgi:hypothetical protein
MSRDTGLGCDYPEGGALGLQEARVLDLACGVGHGAAADVPVIGLGYSLGRGVGGALRKQPSSGRTASIAILAIMAGHLLAIRRTRQSSPPFSALGGRCGGDACPLAVSR